MRPLFAIAALLFSGVASATPVFHENPDVEREGNSILATIVIPAVASNENCQSLGHFTGTQTEMNSVTVGFTGGGWDTSYNLSAVTSAGGGLYKRYIRLCVEGTAQPMTCPGTISVTGVVAIDFTAELVDP